MNVILHVELVQRKDSKARKEDIESFWYEYYKSKGHEKIKSYSGRILEFNGFSNLAQHIESCTIQYGGHESGVVDVPLVISNVQHQVYIYRLDRGGPQLEELEDENVSAATHWLLPSNDLSGLWESLVFDSEIKDELLNFASSALMFADRGVREDIVGLNRVVLLHGPPGTGKTSLCRALAQKLSIRLSSRYSCGQLIEINSHSLFSKWFSESGKLVMRMFSKIHDLVENANSIVCVLIDEVESLAHARTGGQGGTEPSDALRAVNALLTQIDTIRKFPNVLILTTSNITDAIDLAFLDRADIKKYIGPPTYKAFYSIYHTCLSELMRTEIITPKIKLLKQGYSASTDLLAAFPETATLLQLAKKSEGLSGRTARKIPFLAHAMYLQKPEANMNEYLQAMDYAIDQEFNDRSLVNKKQ